jgi:signal transduction histidine kinase
MDLAPEADERIVADQEKLEQIFTSLMSNAIRFTPTGGEITIKAVRDGNFIKTTIADTGIGISADLIPTLFQAVATVQATDVTECDGSEVTLAATRQMVELHGGTLWAESELGTGSRFSFTLPLKNCAGIT